MEYSTIGKEQEISAEGVVYDKGSVYGRLQTLTDKRKARGKRYSLTTLLMIVLLAKLSGADSPTAIAEWGIHHQDEVEALLLIQPKRMPERSTYRRLLAYKVYETEIERMVGEYNQSGERGDICALDGKALLGMLKREDGTSEYALSVYDVQAGKTIAQVEVGSKENEITKAPQAIKLAKIAGKVVTGDALHTQKRLAQTILDEKGDYVFPVKENQSNLYKNIQSLFAPEYPKHGFGKIQADFHQAQKVNKGHGRIEKRTLTTSEMLNTYAAWPGLAQVYRLEREFQWWRKGVCYKTSCEVEFGITSLSRKKAAPMKLLEIRRAHWGIETGSHYRRDVTLKEDATRFIIGNGARVMSNINNLILALIRQSGFLNAAQARRFFAAHLSQAFALLVTPFS
ncbi:MAG: ISAs1 family transposase [Anaerolineales bacterium]|jgi:predicted transposase YbfD/YdcC|uniref:ISAs1 family transposase n=1 Tax=Candidatus Villigracilis saccharophilus TaxID=3140684 RepID=UPI003136FA91|nr:ISAs1 family transposase [Anaerolineales bacterium]MBK8420336.1 ISAs1 family transposase [Anaerolineales bacterium]